MNTCRICFQQVQEVKRYCNCKGDIAVMHLQCLQKQIQFKKDRRKQLACQICLKPYQVQHVYQLDISNLTFILQLLAFLILISLLGASLGFTISSFIKKNIAMGLILLGLSNLQIYFLYNYSLILCKHYKEKINNKIVPLKQDANK